MKTLVIYMLEVLACSGVLLAAYAILLERQVRFRWCRIYLLLSTALAAVIPLLRIPVWPGRVITATPVVAVPAMDGWTADVVPDDPVLTPETCCAAIYLLGVALLTGLLIWQIIRIRRLRRDAEITHTERFTLVRTRQRIASFSFFRSVYVWKETPAAEMRAILAHEASHVAHRHSVERIVMECLKALLWWNPFVWIAARRLTEAEEFEADSDVLKSGYDMEHYMNAIFRQLFGYSPEIANGLRDSLTKKRFKMMTTETPSRHALLRLAGTLPAVIGLLCAFSLTTRAAIVIAPEKVAADATVAATDKEETTVAVQVFKDKKPLAGAIVRVKGTPKGTTTDKQGRARVQAPAGSMVEVSYIGCESQRIRVRKGRIQPVTLTMSADKSADDNARTEVSEATLTDDGAIRESDNVRLSIILMDKDGKSFSSQSYAEGATVQIVGSDRGVVADKQGIARIEAAPGAVLEVKYPGYETIAVAVDDWKKEYFLILRPEGTISSETPLFSRDEDGVKQRPLYIIDGVECQFTANMDINRFEKMQVLTGDAASALYGERGRNGVVVITTKTAAEKKREVINTVQGAVSAEAEEGDDTPYLISETMPVFQGGDLNSFRQWVQSQVQYPAEAMQKGIEGRVVLTFVIEKDGTVSNIQILQSPTKPLSDEARRIIASSPAWTPGKQHGEAVRVRYTLPVDFRIQKKDGDTDKTDQPFLIVETMPVFQGGDLNSFRQWVQSRVRYPVEALNGNITGRVIATFIVEKDGTVSNILIIESPHKSLSDETRRVIASSPAWTPGKQRGEVVRVKYTLPVTFNIAGSDKDAAAEATPAPPKSPNTVDEVVVTGFGTLPK